MRVQIVEITLSNGTVVNALIPAIIEDGAPPLAVRKIRVFEPYEDEAVREQPAHPMTIIQSE